MQQEWPFRPGHTSDALTLQPCRARALGFCCCGPVLGPALFLLLCRKLRYYSQAGALERWRARKLAEWGICFGARSCCSRGLQNQHVGADLQNRRGKSCCTARCARRHPRSERCHAVDLKRPEKGWFGASKLLLSRKPRKCRALPADACECCSLHFAKCRLQPIILERNGPRRLRASGQAG